MYKKQTILVFCGEEIPKKEEDKVIERVCPTNIFWYKADPFFEDLKNIIFQNLSTCIAMARLGSKFLHTYIEIYFTSGRLFDVKEQDIKVFPFIFSTLLKEMKTIFHKIDTGYVIEFVCHFKEAGE